MNVILAFVCTFAILIFSLIKYFVLCFVPRRFRKRKDIKDQIVLITGAGNGLGRELAIQFSKHSTSLVLLDINKQSMLVTKDLASQQCTVFAYQCDVSNSKMVYEIAGEIKKDVGDVDILVNNAGVVVGKRLLDLPDEKIVKTMEVNALAHFWTCKAFLPAMMEKNKGHIVSVTSGLGKHVTPYLTDYCSSKFAAIGFAESLEQELLEQKLDGIKVTIVCTSLIETGMFRGAQQPKVLSTLTPEYAAEEIMAAVLEEQKMVYLPYVLKYMLMIKALVPRWIENWFHYKAGNLRAMKNFKGKYEIQG